jgi:serine protease
MKLFLLAIIPLCFSKRFIIESKNIIKNTTYITNPDKYISLIDCTEDHIKTLPIMNYYEDSEISLDPKSELDIDVPLPQTFPPISWGQDHIDGKFDGEYNYVYTGKKISVYVVDTGVSFHEEFLNDKGNYRLSGKSFIGNPKEFTDCIGHGTHVASTIGGRKYGVSKNVKIISVKIFDCRKTTYLWTLINALEWVSKKKKGIINMSITGPYFEIIDELVKKLVKKGHIVVVAAGNEISNACNYSPASSIKAITVGCIDINNKYCYSGNEGSCVDIFAPGNDIIGADMNGGYTIKSGTSMAAPHVSGIAAQIKQRFPRMKTYKISNIIIRNAANNTLITRLLSSPNLSARLLDTK